MAKLYLSRMPSILNACHYFSGVAGFLACMQTSPISSHGKDTSAWGNRRRLHTGYWLLYNYMSTICQNIKLCTCNNALCETEVEYQFQFTSFGQALKFFLQFHACPREPFLWFCWEMRPYAPPWCQQTGNSNMILWGDDLPGTSLGPCPSAIWEWKVTLASWFLVSTSTYQYL